MESVVMAQQAPSSDVTFAKDIAPILQRSCQNCHRPAGVAPMSLVTYEEVRPWARAIKTRTGIGPRAGVMPPWYVEKNIGIQHYKDDPSLSDEEIAKIAKWADSGAPLGNPADMPPAKVWADDTAWRIGKPDIIVKTKDVVVKANCPGLVGRDRERARSASPKIGTWRRSKSRRSTTCRRRATAVTRSAAASCSTT